MHVILAASGQVPKIPADWPGWLALAGIGLLLAAGLRRWFRS